MADAELLHLFRHQRQVWSDSCISDIFGVSQYQYCFDFAFKAPSLRLHDQAEEAVDLGLLCKL